MIQRVTRSVIDRLESMYSNHGGHIISTIGMHCEALIDDNYTNSLILSSF